MRAYVVGGGSSARGFDWEAEPHAGALVIACHNAAWGLPFAPNVQLSADWIYWASGGTCRPGALPVWVDLADSPPAFGGPPGALRVPATGGLWDHVWSTSLADGLMVGGCSGVPALNLAYLLGALEVHLVGIDLEGVSPDENPWRRLRESFAFAAEQAARGGVTVVPRGKWRP